MDGSGGDEVDALGARGGMLDGREVEVIFLVHFSFSFQKPILVRVPTV